MTRDTTWFHGSPERLTFVLADSTITQDRELARIFSHKPSLVSQEVRGGVQVLRHNGQQHGYLYRIAETLGPEDLYPHDRTRMMPGQEWLTRRDLRVKLLGPTQPVASELLSEREIAELKARVQDSKTDVSP